MSEEEYHKYSKQEIAEGLKQIRGWKIAKGKLHKELDFASFEDAISFMVRVGLEVSKLDHHPEWFNVYNHVVIDLVTHDVGGLSNYDFILAKKVDESARTFRVKSKLVV